MNYIKIILFALIGLTYSCDNSDNTNSYDYTSELKTDNNGFDYEEITMTQQAFASIH